MKTLSLTIAAAGLTAAALLSRPAAAEPYAASQGAAPNATAEGAPNATARVPHYGSTITPGATPDMRGIGSWSGREPSL